jgi:hypothetical protein
MFRQLRFPIGHVLANVIGRNRRAHARSPSGGTSALATVAYGGRTWSCQVRSVSGEGVSLQVPEAVPVGSVVTVALSTESGLFARTLEVCVRRVHTLLDDYHVLDGAFTSGRLAAGDLAALLTPSDLR